MFCCRVCSFYALAKCVVSIEVSHVPRHAKRFLPFRLSFAPIARSYPGAIGELKVGSQTCLSKGGGKILEAILAKSLKSL